MIKDSILEKAKTIFVGRTSELDILVDCYDQLYKGAGQFVLISGVAGIGKTALIQHFLKKRLNSSENNFFMEGFQAAATEEPFAPFFRILMKLGSSYTEDFLTKVKEVAPQISDYHWDSHFNLDVFYQLQVNWVEVQEIIIEELLAASQNIKLVIHLKNLYDATEVDWQFLVNFVKRIQNYPILILGDMRLDGKMEEGDSVPIYSDYLRELETQKNFSRIKLPPFSLKDLKEFFYEVFGQLDFEMEFVESIFRLTHGIPLKIYELLSLLLKKDIFYNKNGIWYSREKDYQSLLDVTAQEDVLDELRRHYEVSAVVEKQVLNILSLTDEIPVSVLEEILQISSSRLIRVLKKLESRKLIHMDNNNVDLRNPQFKYVIKNKIPAKSLKNLNREIAQALWNVNGLPEVRRYWLLGKHFLMADEKKIAFKHFHTAADIFLFKYDLSDALKAFNYCLEILRENTELLDIPEAFEVIMEMAWIKRLTGNLPDALKLTEFARTADYYKYNRYASLVVNLHQLFIYLDMQNWKLAKSILQVLVKSPVSHEDQFLTGLIYYASGMYYMKNGKFQLALKNFIKVLKLAEAFGTDSFRALVNMRIGEVKYWIGRYESAYNYYSSAYEVYSKLSHRHEQAEAALHLGKVLIGMKRWDEANEIISQCLSVCDQTGLNQVKVCAFLYRAIIFREMGKHSMAEEYYQKAINMNFPDGNKPDLEILHLKTVYLQLSGKFEEAQNILQQALPFIKEEKNTLCKARFLYDMAKNSRGLGDVKMQEKQLGMVKEIYVQEGLSHIAQTLDLNSSQLLV